MFCQMKKKSKTYLTLWLLMFTLLPLLSAQAEEKQLELKDLGFATDTIKPDADRQNLLEERTHKLKIHEVMGPITWVLMTATVLTAKEHTLPPVHKTLGLITAASYFSTAYLSLSAPKDPEAAEGKEKTNLKIHKALAWVHFPLMVITPVVGMIAADQLHNGGHIHGIARQKGMLGSLTYLTFSAAFATMIFDF